MGIRTYRPTSAGRRGASVSDFSELTPGAQPEKSLLVPKRKKGGRNNQGFITVRHRGGGHKQQYRLIDFRRDKDGVPAKVASIQYDPNRNARIALLHYVDGEKRYILAPHGLQDGMTVVSGDSVAPEIGNMLQLKFMPLGTNVHNIEMQPGQGGKIARSAGASAQLTNKEEKYAVLKMPSGELRKVLINCAATVGVLANSDHNLQSMGKAGRNRWRGIRPRNRGVAMNPVDHPMGGGEGRTSGGRHPCSPWGKLSKGQKTRNNKRTDSMIVRHRGKKG